MYNSKADMLEAKIDKILKKLKEEEDWANEGLQRDDADEVSYGFYKGVKFLAETLKEI